MGHSASVIGGEMDESTTPAEKASGSWTSRGPLTLFSDTQLAWLAGRGNQHAFEVLYERYRQPLYAYCLSILRSAHDAHDALQNAMLKAFKGLADKQGSKLHLKPWLYRIAHNESISLLRSRKPQTVLEEESLHLSLSSEADHSIRDRLTELLEDLRELPEQQRSALVMRELGGLSYGEIGEALGVSERTATQSVYEARAGLHEFVAGRELGCESIRQTVSQGDRRMLRSRRVRAHLRDCVRCSDFEQATRQRRSDLRMIVPGLSGGGISGLLQRLMEVGAGSGAATSAGGASITGMAATGTQAAGALGGGGKAVATLLTVLAAGSGVAGVESARNVVERAPEKSTTPAVARPTTVPKQNVTSMQDPLPVAPRPSVTARTTEQGEGQTAGRAGDKAESRSTKLPPATSEDMADEAEQLLNQASQNPGSVQSPSSSERIAGGGVSTPSSMTQSRSGKRGTARSQQQAPVPKEVLKEKSVVKAAEQLLAKESSDGF